LVALQVFEAEVGGDLALPDDLMRADEADAGGEVPDLDRVRAADQASDEQEPT
jgi:hypothetical protein